MTHVGIVMQLVGGDCSGMSGAWAIVVCWLGKYCILVLCCVCTLYVRLIFGNC